MAFRLTYDVFAHFFSQAILLVLGSGALALTMPIALAITLLVLLVVFSYTQTILHYPQGGGAYIVADNLGRLRSLIMGGALLVDYVLTVAVSESAGIRALTSAFPNLLSFRLELALLVLVILTFINLRGVRESGMIFNSTPVKPRCGLAVS